MWYLIVLIPEHCLSFSIALGNSQYVTLLYKNKIVVAETNNKKKQGSRVQSVLSCYLFNKNTDRKIDA